MAQSLSKRSAGGSGSEPPRTATPSLTASASFAVKYGDRIYSTLIFLAALSIFVIMVAIAWDLAAASGPSIHSFGFKYVFGSDWDETRNAFAILPFIFGTLYSSLIALILAVPVSIGAAIFLSELAPKWIRTPLTFLIELLAAIPSVVYGLWGIFVMIPWLKTHVMDPISHSFLSHIPVFAGSNPIGNSMLAAGVILAIMVTPFITAVARDILRAIPRSQREGSYALGATQWETLWNVVIPYAKSGIIGAVILGLGRALGETMAVTMVIGNQSAGGNGISWSVMDPGYTLASALANKFNEAVGVLNQAALIEIGLVLFVVAIIVNMFARLLVYYTAKDSQGRT
jgi:phosphate transport system permease protein